MEAVGLKREREREEDTEQQMATPQSANIPHTAPAPVAERATLVRQRAVMEKERSGELRFDVITNDGQDQTMMSLVELKNIFAKQLPKMPKEYIVRLVLDRNHFSLVCVAEGEIVGGICYRPHFTQGFAEVAFCAVTASRQVKGFGTRMMNQLKQIVKKEGIEFMLTYADNYAIGYFKKQGFNRLVTMKRERWVGYIKDYDGGTLMECPISEHVDYTNLPKMIEAQRGSVLVMVSSRQPAPQEHAPLTELIDFQIDEHGDVIGGEDHALAMAKLVPRLAEVGLRLPRYEYTLNGARSSLSAVLEKVVRQLAAHEQVWPFALPVDKTEAPDYYDVVLAPMDFAWIQRKVAIGTYRTLRQMVADVRLIASNCRMYNGEDNVYTQCASAIEDALDAELESVQEIQLD